MTDPHRSLPESNPASPLPASVASASDERESRDASFMDVPEEHREVLRRLHRRVEDAVETIQRLRRENERLRGRVEELEAQPAFPDAETVLTLDDDPDDLREQITHFIETIDSYLESTPSTSSLDLESTGPSADEPDV